MSTDHSKLSAPGGSDAERKKGGFSPGWLVRWACIVVFCFFLLVIAGVMLLTLLLALNVFFPDPSIEMSVFDTLGEIAMWVGFLLAELLALGSNIFILKQIVESEQ